MELRLLGLGLVMRVRVRAKLSDSVLSRGFIEGHGVTSRRSGAMAWSGVGSKPGMEPD